MPPRLPDFRSRAGMSAGGNVHDGSPHPITYHSPTKSRSHSAKPIAAATSPSKTSPYNSVSDYSEWVADRPMSALLIPRSHESPPRSPRSPRAETSGPLSPDSNKLTDQKVSQNLDDMKLALEVNVNASFCT